MADVRVIDQRWLNDASRVVDQITEQAEQMRGAVAVVSRRAADLGQDIQTVTREFNDYRQYDRHQKELANAKTQIVHVRQQVREKFGNHDAVRQYLTGILEARDLSLVKRKTVSREVERLMLACPEYWLAPCLVAIAAWLDDNKPLADRAIQEAIKRDDEKTSLLMSLVCRRIGRMNASAVWLERYLAMQDPTCMERKMTTVLDAYSNGMFGPESKQRCADRIDAWLAELKAKPGFVEAQQASWEEAMESKVENESFAKNYPYSAKYCTNWGALSGSMSENGLYQVLLNYFKGIFDKKIVMNGSLESRLDELLETYVSSYDDEELPLRREERMLELIIQEKGNRARAEDKYAAEQKALEDHFDFTQLLTSAAMHADLIKASNATQRMSIALSKDWVVSAFNNMVMKIRSHIPASFQCSVAEWQFELQNPEQEAALCAEADQVFTGRRDLELAAVKQSKLDMILPIVFAVGSILGFINSPTWGFLGLIAAGGGVLNWFLSKKRCEQKKKDIWARYEQLIQDVKNTVHALCAERYDYVSAIIARDAVSAQTGYYLQSLEVGEHIARGSHRQIAAN